MIVIIVITITIIIAITILKKSLLQNFIFLCSVRKS